MKNLAWLLTLLLAACSAPRGPRFDVAVNAFARAGAEPKRTYVLLSDDKNIPESDLEFQEYAGHVERALAYRGLQKAAQADSADLVIFFHYAIGGPEEHSYTRNIPVFGQTGVASTYTSGTLNLSGNSGSYSQTTTVNPTYGITGYQTQQRSYTTYGRRMSLTAYDLQEYRRSKTMTVVWQTRIVSVGSSGDLRQVLPIMLAAGRDFLGTSTGKMVDISLFEDDPRVLDVKGAAAPTREHKS